MDLAPAEALVRRHGTEQRIPVDDVRVGDLIIVKPGEKIPLDGRVHEGSSHVNQAPVTGESLPAEKLRGDEVFAGSINGRGALEIEVTRLRRDSTLARIIHLVEQAQAQRAPSQTFVDRFARVYTPAVILLAAILAIVPPVAFGGEWATWIYRSLVLLVISCPCALVISTPVSIVSALAAAARKGVLIKGGARLERLATVRCVAFDKTGTLTRGRLRVTDIVSVNGARPIDILSLAASLESKSEHPIGRAILERANDDALTLSPVTAFQALPGRGAEGSVTGRPVVVGSHRLFEERQMCSAEAEAILDRLAAEGRTSVMVGVNGAAVGVIGVADETRESAADAIQMLRDQGVEHVAMLTGDQESAARALASSIGIDDFRAGLLPEHKLSAVHDLRRQYGALAMGVGELLGDKMKSAPDRTVFLGLLARVMSAGIAGAALAPKGEESAGAAVAVATAVPLAYLTLSARKEAMARIGQTRSGLIEDALIVAAGAAIVALATKPAEGRSAGSQARPLDPAHP